MSVELGTISQRKPSEVGIDPFETPVRGSSVQTIAEEIVGSTPDLEDLSDAEEDSYPDGGLKAYSVLLGLFMGSVVNLGIINSIGAIQIFSIYLCLSYAFALVTGNIFDRHGPVGLLVGSTVFIFVGLMGAASSVEVWQFILSFISLGIGNGLGMAPLISVISHWFLKKRGNCTGIATSGGSVGGLVFPLMLRYLYAKYDFEWALRILAFTCLGFMLVALALVRGRFTKPKTVRDSSSKWTVDLRHSFHNVGFGILRKPKFVYLILGGFFAEISLVLLLTYFASYAIAQGSSESDSYLLLTVWNATGILGRWIPGYVSDVYGRFNINVLMLLMYNLCIFVIWLPFGKSQTLLYVFAGLGGYALGSIFSLLPACLSQVTPVNEIGTTYGLLNACLSLANLFGIPVASAIIGKGTVHDYNMFVVLVGCLSVLGTTFWILSRYTLVGLKLNVKV